jgi:hypothetical protein
MTPMLTWDAVLAWRMRRQFLAEPTEAGAVEVARRLCGVQAQVPSSAELAVAVRSAVPQRGGLAAGLAARTLMRTWAMRGTLHVLPVDVAPAYLALLAAARPWARPSWQRAFLSLDEVDALAAAATEVLDGRVLTREELIAEVADRMGPQAAEHIRSGWGTVLKPLAWQGLLCQGPASGTRVTFTRADTYLPGWTGLPEPVAAARTAVDGYLGAYGPATAATFGNWLSRGVGKAMVQGWFAELAAELVTVEVDGRPLLARAADADEIAATRPSRAVRLLAGFDQYVLGPGTDDEQVVPPAHRTDVSRTSGWIAPVVLAGGRVAGTWQAADGALDVVLFADAPPVDRRALDAEIDRLRDVLGAPAAASVRTG